MSPGDQIHAILVVMLTVIGICFAIAAAIRLRFFGDRVWGCVFLMVALMMVVPGALAGLSW